MLLNCSTIYLKIALQKRNRRQDNQLRNAILVFPAADNVNLGKKKKKEEEYSVYAATHRLYKCVFGMPRTGYEVFYMPEE